MCKLVRDGEAAGADPVNDKWAAELNRRVSTFKQWLESVEEVLDKLGVGSSVVTRMLCLQIAYKHQHAYIPCSALIYGNW